MSYDHDLFLDGVFPSFQDFECLRRRLKEATESSEKQLGQLGSFEDALLAIQSWLAPTEAFWLAELPTKDNVNDKRNQLHYYEVRVEGMS